MELGLEETFSFPRLSAEQKRARVERAIALQQAYAEERLRQEALNALESAAYRARDWLQRPSDALYLSAESKAGLEQQLALAMAVVEAPSASASALDFKSELQSLTRWLAPAEARRHNDVNLPSATQHLKQALDTMQSTLKRLKSSSKSDISDALLDKATQLTNEISSWLEKQTQLQKKQLKSEEPVLWIRQVEERGRELEQMRARLDPKAKANSNLSDLTDLNELSPEALQSLLESQGIRQASNGNATVEQLREQLAEWMTKKAASSQEPSQQPGSDSKPGSDSNVSQPKEHEEL